MIPSERELQKVLDVLVLVGILNCPTDSLYAFGSMLHSPKAFERLRRKRCKDAVACLVLFGNMDHLAEYCRVHNTLFRNVKRNLRAPFTFVLTASSRVHPKAQVRRRTIGIRLPHNAIAPPVVGALG